LDFAGKWLPHLAIRVALQTVGLKRQKKADMECRADQAAHLRISQRLTPLTGSPPFHPAKTPFTGGWGMLK